MAGRWIAALAKATGSAAIARLDGATLLGERAALRGLRVPGLVSAGGGCRLYEASDGIVAVNLARADDRALLPALFEAEAEDVADVAGLIRARRCETLLARGSELGLAIASADETPGDAVTVRARGPSAPRPAARTAYAPRVLDLSALWAGPLATHLLALAGATVTAIDSAGRPDAMRHGDPLLFDRLARGKRRESLDLRAAEGRARLRDLVDAADMVVAAARPRALRQLGIDVDALVEARPGLVWATITGHGAANAGRVGFGDDAGVAGGLTAALHIASGAPGFVGDAIADPLTGIRAAAAIWHAWQAGAGVHLMLAMSGVAAGALAEARAVDADALARPLRAWRRTEGRAFPPVGTARC